MLVIPRKLQPETPYVEGCHIYCFFGNLLLMRREHRRNYEKSSYLFAFCGIFTQISPFPVKINRWFFDEFFRKYED